MNTHVFPPRLRSSVFNVLIESYFPGTWLLFNTASGSLLTFDEETLAATEAILSAPNAGWEDSSIQDLLAQGFLTEHPDERASLRQSYFAAKDTGRSGSLMLTISPTIACNFRCTYCFQSHPSKSMTDWDVAALRALADRELETSGHLHVSWFGGEPLVAFPILKKLHRELTTVVAQKGATYSHDIITNGLLLKGERLDWLCEHQMQMVQITLDGPEAFHDQRRPSAGGTGTYRKIMQNLEKAAPLLPISLRVNVDRRNVGSLDTLLDDMVEIGLHRHVAPYLGHVLEYTDECEDLREHSLTLPEFACTALEFKKALLLRGFRKAHIPLPKPRAGGICTADSPHGLVVSPGGRLVGCWNEATDDADYPSASLQHDGTISSMGGSSVERWNNYDPFTHAECHGCLVQPLCKGGCPWEADRKPPEGSGLCTPLRWTLGLGIPSFSP